MKKEEHYGLFEEPTRIGLRRQWADVLSAEGVRVRGHRLIRNRGKIPTSGIIESQVQN